MPRRRFRPVRRRRAPGPLAWAGFAGGVTMGALAATLIVGNDEQPPPQTSQLAAGELPEALKNLVAEYLAEEGYQPAESTGEEPAPAPLPAPVPVPAPAPAVPVPVAPVSTRSGSEFWPIEIVPEPITLPVQVPPLTIQAAAPVSVDAALDAAPVALRAAVDTEPVAPRTEAETTPVALKAEIDSQPEPAVAEEPVSFASQESTVAPQEGRALVTHQAEVAPEPEISPPTIAEVSSADAIVVPAEPEPPKKKEKKLVEATKSDEAEGEKERLVEGHAVSEAQAEEAPREVIALVEAESGVG